MFIEQSKNEYNLLVIIYVAKNFLKHLVLKWNM